MVKLFEVVLGADDGLYHLFLLDDRVLRDGYSSPEDAFKAFHEKYREGYEASSKADRAIAAGENVVRFPVPDRDDDRDN